MEAHVKVVLTRKDSPIKCVLYAYARNLHTKTQTVFYASYVTFTKIVSIVTPQILLTVVCVTLRNTLILYLIMGGASVRKCTFRMMELVNCVNNPLQTVKFAPIRKTVPNVMSIIILIRILSMVSVYV